MANPDIFEYARARVENKSVTQRIWHSSKLHQLRSALQSKGSMVSKAGKLAGVAVRGACSLIPVPVLGSLLSAAESGVEDWKRQGAHNTHKNKAASLAERVKFELKDLSVEELDRYRWKVNESLQEYNRIAASFSSTLETKAAAAAPCDALVDLAIAIAQLQRRIDILRTNCMATKVALEEAIQWVDEVATGTASPKGAASPKGDVPEVSQKTVVKSGGFAAITKQSRETILKFATDQKDASEKAACLGKDMQEKERNGQQWIADNHGQCSGWCMFHPENGKDNYAELRSQAAKVVKFLSTPLISEMLEGLNKGVRAL
jgi:hypothetical protein